MATVYTVIGIVDTDSSVIVGIFDTRTSMFNALQDKFNKCYLKSGNKRVDVLSVSVGIHMKNRFCKLYSKQTGKELYRIYAITLNKVNPKLDESSQ